MTHLSSSPDPALQFLVEVDASDVGVGVVLSQRQGPDAWLPPCAFFSCRLSPAEANYDIGNRELLAVKLALEEWRHWLEGSTQPFMVWTNHKNLAYIQGYKPGGNSSATLTSRSLFAPAPRTSSLTPSPSSSAWRRRHRKRKTSSQRHKSLLSSRGTLKRPFSRPNQTREEGLVAALRPFI
ncbi:hypothetical protein L3Q82_007843 [Scortum barcoo]|uniref:Uncharacterized protein n=1 Tax=Scortum barcoo TaxID=214431 RepID=A0ACB8WK51_9TELE|nr:hypothetical protein L3Q82_007843 [Scortum barcoo]